MSKDALGGHTILVVEDEPPIALMLYERKVGALNAALTKILRSNSPEE